MIAVRSSVMGRAAQMPVMPNARDSMYTAGMIIINPREKEIMCAGRGCSVAVKKDESTVFSPAKGIEVK